MIKPLALLILLIIALDVQSDSLKLMSWNIANLAEPGKALRGMERATSDYEVLRNIISTQNPDILALQEIGSIEAIEAILPAGVYEFQFEKRCYNNSTKCETVPRNSIDQDIYTAIAIKKELFVSNTDSFFDVAGTTNGKKQTMDIEHISECRGKKPRKVRGAVGASVSFRGRSLKIPSVHNKATCKSAARENGKHTADDCITGQTQMSILGAWAKATQTDGHDYIIAGDFNRQFLHRGNTSYRESFQSTSSHSLDFFPKDSRLRKCWAPDPLPYDKDALVAKVKSTSDTKSKLIKFAAQNIKPIFFEPKSSHEIDFFAFNKATSSAYKIKSEQIQMNEFLRVGEISHDFLIEDCDGNVIPLFNNSSFFFAQSFPSDHCPILMQIEPE